MDTEQLLAPEDMSPLGRSRADVLDMLRAADGPLGVREVAQRMGLHPNTARFHLEALVEAGLAVRETEDRETPGRPRIGYRAAADGPAGRRRYRLGRRCCRGRRGGGGWRSSDDLTRRRGDAGRDGLRSASNDGAVDGEALFDQALVPLAVDGAPDPVGVGRLDLRHVVRDVDGHRAHLGDQILWL